MKGAASGLFPSVLLWLLCMPRPGQPSSCGQAASCPDCRARSSCSWCDGACRARCPPDRELWLCPDQPTAPPPAAECLMLAQLGSVGRLPIGLAAARLPTGGMLQLQGQAPADCHLRPGPALHCTGRPALPLSECSALRPGRAGSLQLDCSDGPVLISAPAAGQRQWARVLMSVINAQLCEAAVGQSGLSGYERGAVRLLAGVLWSRVGLRESSLPHWREVGGSWQVAGAAGWALADAGLWALANGRDGREPLEEGAQLLEESALAAGGEPGVVCEVSRLWAIAGLERRAERLLNQVRAARECWECDMLLSELAEHDIRKHKERVASAAIKYMPPPTEWQPGRTADQGQFSRWVGAGHLPAVLLSSNTSCPGWAAEGGLANQSGALVSVELSPELKGRLGRGLRTVKLRLPLSEAVELMARSSWQVYLNVGPVDPSQGPYAPPLEAMENLVPPPAAIGAIGAKLLSANLWMAHQPTFGALHSDPDPNLLTTARGSKRIWLLPPSELSAACPVQPPVAVDSSGAMRFEHKSAPQSFFSIRPTGCGEEGQGRWLEAPPGAVVFIPRGWWHRVDSVPDEGGVHAAVNFWYRERT